MDKAERDNIRAALGLYLSRARVARDLSQEQLGELAELSANHISKIERGCAGVKFENLIKIAVALELSLDDFILREYLAKMEDGGEKTVSYRTALEKQRKEDEAGRLKEAMSQAIDRIYRI